jgi:hypothetical protein
LEQLQSTKCTETRRCPDQIPIILPAASLHIVLVGALPQLSLVRRPALLGLLGFSIQLCTAAFGLLLLEGIEIVEQ